MIKSQPMSNRFHFHAIALTRTIFSETYLPNTWSENPAPRDMTIAHLLPAVAMAVT